MNPQHVVLLVLLDLSAAFDTVEHSILLYRLSNSLRWFKSYLTDRFQRVSLDGTVSEKLQLTQGVPQGSCLGPSLFTFFASKLFDIEGHLPDAHTYAAELGRHYDGRRVDRQIALLKFLCSQTAGLRTIQLKLSIEIYIQILKFKIQKMAALCMIKLSGIYFFDKLAC